MLQYQVRPGSSPTSPLLVLLHGLGSDERDLLSLGVELSDSATICAIRAPHGYEMGGYSWFPVGWSEEGIQVDQGQALKSLDLLLDMLNELPTALKIEPSKVILGGFSQGAMMTIGAILRDPARFAGALILSGAPLPAFFPEVAPIGLAELPVLAQHGAMDPVLPIDLGRGAAAALAQLGAKPDFREYPMQHELSYASLRDAKAWVDQIIGPQGWLVR